jgi:hypothetical protein
LVNEVADTLGVGAELLDGLVVLVLVVLDDEPHAATPNNAVTASAARTALLFSRRKITSLSF